jgi:hypothetical protein
MARLPLPPARCLCIAAAVPLAAPALAQVGGPYDLTWSTLDCGGDTTPSTGGDYAISGTVGQHDAGQASAGPYVIIGGFWAATAPVPCYANCDWSTTHPILNVADFACFLNRFSVGDAYANCDGSTTAPALNVIDFACFLQKFGAGCQ